MPAPSPSEEFAQYENDLARTLTAVRARLVAIHLPARRELHRRLPGAHFHSAPELLIQTGGMSDFLCPGTQFRMQPGDVCVMPRGVPHAETPIHGPSPYGLLVCMHFRDGQYLHRGRMTDDGLIEGHGTRVVPGDRARDAFRFLDDATARESIDTEYQTDCVRALVEVFLMTTLSEIRNSTRQDPNSGPVINPVVIAAERLARSRLADPTLTVGALARALGLSTDHLSRQFHRARGQTLLSWIVQERIHLACDLLREPQYNIAEVGWACGFNQPSYFIRVFKSLRGLTPRAYRASVADREAG